MPKHPSVIKTGQVWKDLDIRATHDEFTVLYIEDGVKPGVFLAVCQRGPRKSRINVERLLRGPEGKNRGYQYVGMKR